MTNTIGCDAGLVSVASSGLSKTAIIGISVGAGAVVVIVGFLIFLAFRLRRKAENERKKNPFGKATSKPLAYNFTMY